MSFPYVASGTGTDQDLLDLVRQGIATVVATGQEIEIRGRKYTRADLGELRTLEKQLQSRVSNAQGPARNRARMVRTVY
jgi:hypothetical protein